MAGLESGAARLRVQRADQSAMLPSSSRYHLVQSAIDGIVCANSVNTAQMAHYLMQLSPGDVVIVADKSTLRGDYCLAPVKEVFSKRKRKSVLRAYSVK